MDAKRKEDFIDFIYEVKRATQAMRAFLRNKIKDSGHDLTFEMLQVLKSLWDKENVNQQELANITQKDKASLTYLLDNLSKRKLVIRTEDQNDRRNKLISLTKAGTALRKVMQPALDKMYAVAGNDLDKESLSICINLFQKINRNFEGPTDLNQQ